jgi:hypothetical protein
MKKMPKKPVKTDKVVSSEMLKRGQPAMLGMEREERMEELHGNYYAKNKDSRLEEKREAMMGFSCGGLVKH